MRVQNTNQHYIKFTPKNSINFGSNFRTGNYGKNWSTYFRRDLDWDDFATGLINKYKNTKKVNVYSLACSEGAEPLTLAMILIDKLGEKEAQKFFPIIASDIDEKILQNPLKGIMKLSENDLKKIKAFFDYDKTRYSKFFDSDYKFQYDDEFKETLCSATATPLLRDAVTFEQKDIRNHIKEIIPDNSVVLSRNFSSYISEKEHAQFAKQLSNALGENSLCVFGNIESDLKFEKLLPEGSFYDASNSCYVKLSQSERELLSNPNFLAANFITNNTFSAWKKVFNQ